MALGPLEKVALGRNGEQGVAESCLGLGQSELFALGEKYWEGGLEAQPRGWEWLGEKKQGTVLLGSGW